MRWLCLVYAAAVVVSYYEGMVPVVQGRFLLPALLPVVLLLTWGLWLYGGREKLILALVAGLWAIGLAFTLWQSHPLLLLLE